MKLIKAKILPLFALSATLGIAQDLEADTSSIPIEVTGAIVDSDFELLVEIAPIDSDETSSEPAVRNSISRLNIKNAPLAKLLQAINKNQQSPFNYVYKNKAENMVIPKLNLQSISHDAFLEILEDTLDVRIKTISNAAGADVIIISGPSRAFGGGINDLGTVPADAPRGQSSTATFHRHTTENSERRGKRLLNSAQAIPQDPANSQAGLPLDDLPMVGNLFSNSRPTGGQHKNLEYRLVQPELARPYFSPAKTSPPKAGLTQIFGTADLTTDREVILDLVRTVWEVSDPAWQTNSNTKILFHPKTGILIVKGPQERIVEVESILTTLRQEQHVATEKAKKMGAGFGAEGGFDIVEESAEIESTKPTPHTKGGEENRRNTNRR